MSTIYIYLVGVITVPVLCLAACVWLAWPELRCSRREREERAIWAALTGDENEWRDMQRQMHRTSRPVGLCIGERSVPLTAHTRMEVNHA